MNSISLLAVTIFSGAIAGTILAIINLGLVEPYIDSAISLETQRKISSGENVNMAELVHYRIWQKGGAIARDLFTVYHWEHYLGLYLRMEENHYREIVIGKRLFSWLEYYGLCYT